MGYDTGFAGEFSLDRPLTSEHRGLLEEYLEENDDCQWVPNEDGTAIVWEEVEKFSDYVDHLKELVKEFLGPWGYRLNGIVTWHGEEYSDVGTMWVVDNTVRVFESAAIQCEQLLRNVFGDYHCQQCECRSDCFPEGM
jgi:hypothetical protein